MELEFIEWVASRSRASSSVRLSIGDDAAIVDLLDAPTVISCDSIADGTHFRVGEHDLKTIGRKALAVNLSDMAAMAAIPKFATVCFQLPQNFGIQEAQALYLGIEELALEFGTTLVGGDTNRWEGKLVISINIFGPSVPTAGWRLCGARPDDVLLVTGSLGGSILGRHLNFQPRCEVALKLAASYAVNAATDLSDSFSIDLHQMCNASNCGAIIKTDRLPISDDAHELSKSSNLSPLEHALFDGEDFELLLSVTPSTWKDIQSDTQLAAQLSEIGTISSHPGIQTVDSEGNLAELPLKGYRH